MHLMLQLREFRQSTLLQRGQNQVNLFALFFKVSFQFMHKILLFIFGIWRYAKEWVKQQISDSLFPCLLHMTLIAQDRVTFKSKNSAGGRSGSTVVALQASLSHNWPMQPRLTASSNKYSSFRVFCSPIVQGLWSRLASYKSKESTTVEKSI